MTPFRLTVAPKGSDVDFAMIVGKQEAQGLEGGDLIREGEEPKVTALLRDGTCATIVEDR